MGSDKRVPAACPGQHVRKLPKESGDLKGVVEVIKHAEELRQSRARHKEVVLIINLFVAALPKVPEVASVGPFT